MDLDIASPARIKANVIMRGVVEAPSHENIQKSGMNVCVITFALVIIMCVNIAAGVMRETFAFTILIITNEILGPTI
jgi:hypothetical protein